MSLSLSTTPAHLSKRARHADSANAPVTPPMYGTNRGAETSSMRRHTRRVSVQNVYVGSRSTNGSMIVRMVPARGRSSPDGSGVSVGTANPVVVVGA